MSNQKTLFFEKILIFLQFFPDLCRKITFWCYICKQKKDKKGISA